MEKHFWSQESFVSNVNLSLLSSYGVLMYVFFEFIGLHYFALFIHCFLIKFVIFLHNILAYITIPLFYFLSYLHGLFRRKFFISISKMLQYEFSDVSASQRDMPYATSNNKSI